MGRMRMSAPTHGTSSAGASIYTSQSLSTGGYTTSSSHCVAGNLSSTSSWFVYFGLVQTVTLLATHASDPVVACKAFGGVVGHMMAFSQVHFWSNCQIELMSQQRD